MANQPFNRASGKGKFAYLGIDLLHPPDLQPPGRCPMMLNLTPNKTQGSLAPRGGLESKISLSTTAAIAPVHTIKRVFDYLPSAAFQMARFAGSATSLYIQNALHIGGDYTPFSLLDSGFSGNPLVLLSYRPPQTPETWVYAFDSKLQRKYKTDGTTKANIGILPPNTPPITTQAQPLITPLLDVTSTTGWSGTGGAGAPSTAQRVPASTTIAAIILDTGSTPSWGCIQPTNAAGNYSWLGVGARLTIDSEILTVLQVFPAMSATTILGFTLDASGSGIGTVQATTALTGLARNALVNINGTNVRVLSVSQGPDGLTSFRAVLPGGLAAGQAITIPVSFRVYVTASHSVGAAMTQTVLTSAVTLTGALTSTALLANTTITPVDLTQISGRPLMPEDYLTFSVLVGTPANVSEIHLMLDVDSTTNDFNHNYYYVVVRQNDFLPSALGATLANTTLLGALSNQIASGFEYKDQGQGAPPVSSSLDAGAGQWFDCIVKINDLVRVGGDNTVGLNKIKGIGLMAVVTGNSSVSLGSIWVGGTYGPDANWNSYGNQGTEIIYRYRYRSSVTGAMSNQSPATRSGELPLRNALRVSVTASTDPQVDTIDVERLGGTQDTWHRCMVLPNTSGTYLDLATETFVAASEPLELGQLAPWPITDKPRNGTCNIVGTTVNWVSGDIFNTNWLRGVEIIVNNQTYTLEGPPISGTQLQTIENIGVLTGVAFSIPEATIIGFPLPYVCGPFDGRFFGAGDPYNPGNLYWTQPYNPDSCDDKGYIEVSSPNDGLLMPVVFEGAVYVFSTQFLFRVESTPGQPNPYASYRLGTARGLAAPWAVTAEGPIMAWLSDTGINAMGAQNSSVSITKDLYTLFPYEGRPALPAVFPGFTLYPPDYSKQATLRLAWVQAQLMFTYTNINNGQTTLCYDLESKAWIPYQYATPVFVIYQEGN